MHGADEFMHGVDGSYMAGCGWWVRVSFPFVFGGSRRGHPLHRGRAPFDVPGRNHRDHAGAGDIARRVSGGCGRLDRPAQACPDRRAGEDDHGCGLSLPSPAPPPPARPFGGGFPRAVVAHGHSTRSQHTVTAHGHSTHGHSTHGHSTHGHSTHGHSTHGHSTHGHITHSHSMHGHSHSAVVPHSRRQRTARSSHITARSRAEMAAVRRKWGREAFRTRVTETWQSAGRFL